jgi:hypothetical protein
MTAVLDEMKGVGKTGYYSPALFVVEKMTQRSRAA